MAFDVDDFLRQVVQLGGSDLHLKVGAPPMARVNGALAPMEGGEALTPEDTEGAARKLLSDDRAREEFAEEGEADLSYALKGISRFRVNVFRQRGSVSVVCRAIPFQVRTIEDLGLPPVIRKLADEPRGIILLTGTTGSGKSTTLAAMIDHINSKYARHVITLEDPIEYLHRDKKSIINQREVGSDTAGFGRAMRRVLRQDPDVILIGEMRDEETVRTALSAAETGHLVLSTLHTLDATETINRIIDFFPPHLQQQARVMLAATLKGAVSQRLVPTHDKVGRIAAAEVLVVTGRIQDLILNPNETGKITQVIAEGDFYGMQTFDQSLLKHVTEGRVDERTALEFASSPHDFQLMLASAGKSASDMSNVLGEETKTDAHGAYDDDLPALDDEEDADEPTVAAVKPAPPTPPADPEEYGAEPAVDVPAAEEEPPSGDDEESSSGGDEEPSSGDDEEPFDPEKHSVDYGSPEHAYGRSLTPQRPAPGAASPTEPVAPSVPDRVSADEAGDDEYGADGEQPDEPAERGAESAAPAGLGDPAFSDLWEPDGEDDGERETAPRATDADDSSGKDRLAEFRPRDSSS